MAKIIQMNKQPSRHKALPTLARLVGYEGSKPTLNMLYNIDKKQFITTWFYRNNDNIW